MSIMLQIVLISVGCLLIMGVVWWYTFGRHGARTYKNKPFDKSKL